jgi:hypothetical protein
MLDRAVRILAQVLTHPANALAFHDVVGIQKILDTRYRSHMATDDDGRCRR